MSETKIVGDLVVAISLLDTYMTFHMTDLWAYIGLRTKFDSFWPII